MSLLQETILIHGGEEGSHIKISLLYSGLLPTWKDHMHFLSLAAVEFRYTQLDLGLLITFACLSIRISNYFVTETNRFAEQFISGDDLSRRSRANSWHPTDPHEMKQFLGLLFLTGIIRKPAINLYWSTDPLYSTPLFGAIMSRNRFQLLLKFLHFNDNAQMPGADDPSPDKLFKVRPLLDHLCDKFGEVYTPSCNISIDESLLLWKGRLGFKQYIPLKRARFGIKCFMLCEDSGYTFKFKIYTGRENVPPPAGALSVSERVVADLIEPLLDKGYHLYIDNWYTSIPLLKFLFDHGTLACGTIQSNRKGFPDPVKKAKLKRGEVKAYRSNELLSMKFKDKRDVLMLTTIHNEEMVPGQRLAAHHKPRCISDYNKYMGGVDRTDQLMQPYEMARKSLKWYKKLACHFLQLAMLNSFLVFKKDLGRKRFLEFSMMSFQCFSLVQKMTSLTFQERKMLYDLLKGTFWSISHQQQTREKHRRGAESVIRKIYERKPATTVQVVNHSLDCAATLASNFTTQFVYWANT